MQEGLERRGAATRRQTRRDAHEKTHCIQRRRATSNVSINQSSNNRDAIDRDTDEDFQKERTRKHIMRPPQPPHTVSLRFAFVVDFAIVSWPPGRGRRRASSACTACSPCRPPTACWGPVRPRARERGKKGRERLSADTPTSQPGDRARGRTFSVSGTEICVRRRKTKAGPSTLSQSHPRVKEPEARRKMPV